MYYRFIGKDGSMGFINGNIYDLEVFKKGNEILIYAKSGVKCPYQNINKFKENWELAETAMLDLSKKKVNRKSTLSLMNNEDKEALGHLEWLLDNGILASEDEEKIDRAITIIIEFNKKIREAYRVANNILWFDDSSDYCSALWDILHILNPDLPDDNYEIELKYIEEDGKE